MYTPPFTISTEAINKIANISRLIERYAIRMVRKHLTTLKEKGLITRVGSNKTGHWTINK